MAYPEVREGARGHPGLVRSDGAGLQLQRLGRSAALRSYVVVPISDTSLTTERSAGGGIQVDIRTKVHPV
jgi:hypothetical protein